MDTETHAIPEGAVSGKSGLPLDVRIVARLLYVTGGLGVLCGILLWSGVIERTRPFFYTTIRRPVTHAG